MTPELKGQWVTALRSGKYRQCQGMLRKDRGKPEHCCLGVLCEVAGAFTQGKAAPDEGALCWDLSEKLGVSMHQSDLIRMNDSQGCTFAEIADYIEGNL